MVNSKRLTPVQWTICVIAAIGFAFDTYELLMMPLILRPARLELTQCGSRHAGIQSVAGIAVLPSRLGWWCLRFARRLSNRSARPGGACLHGAFCFTPFRRLRPGIRLRSGCCFFFRLHDIRWRVRRIRGRGRMACRALPGAEAVRTRIGIYTILFVVRRYSRRDREPLDRVERGRVPCDLDARMACIASAT